MLQGSTFRRIGVSTIAVVLLASVSPGFAEDAPSPRAIMEWVESRDDGDDGTREIELILIDRNGSQRVRRIRSFFKDRGNDRQEIMFFTEPADVKDVAFLTYDYDAETDRDDDQWLYLPALKRVKRIASSDQSGSFMGSDFNYSDMTSRNLDRYEYSLMGEREIDGSKVWVVECVARTKEEMDQTGYRRSVLFVRQDSKVVVRAMRWTSDGETVKLMDVKELEEIDGIWVPTEVHMTSRQGDSVVHRTVLRVSNVRFDQGLDGSMFSTRRLEAGL